MARKMLYSDENASASAKCLFLVTCLPSCCVFHELGCPALLRWALVDRGRGQSGVGQGHSWGSCLLFPVLP